jgi:hypothetical protein
MRKRQRRNALHGPSRSPVRPARARDWAAELRAVCAAGARRGKAVVLAAMRLGALAGDLCATRLWPFCLAVARVLGLGARAFGRVARGAGRAGLTHGRRAWRAHARAAWRHLGFVPSFGIGVGLLAGLGSHLVRNAHPVAFGWRWGAGATLLALGVGLVLHAKSTFVRALEDQ